MEYIYKYIEIDGKCDICWENNKCFFKCKRCTFKGCPLCFNKFYFSDEIACPQCRYFI